MAFRWILGKRRDDAQRVVEGHARMPVEEGAGEAGRQEQRRGDHDSVIRLADIMLSIEDGLVLAYGPHGDPVPPNLLIACCRADPNGELRLPNGDVVDHERLLAVLSAQQAGPLAGPPGCRWVRAMLGVEGRFQEASPAALAKEDSEGKSMLAGRLSLDMPGGDTITLLDAHPGSARFGAPIRLVVDGLPHALEDVLGRAASDQPAPGSSGALAPVITRHGDAVALRLGETVEAGLETTEAVWDGAPMVDLFLNDGRPVAIDDLAAVNVAGAGSHSLTVSVMSTVGDDGTLEKQSRTVTLPLASGDAAPALSPAASRSERRPASAVPLVFDEAVTCRAVLADALLVRGIPDGASLSAGIFDASVKGWVLRPSLLDKLQVLDLDQGTRSIEIELTAVHLDQEGRSRARVIARKTLTGRGSGRRTDRS